MGLYLKENNILSFVNEASAYHGVKSALILAHIKAESNFNEKAVRNEPSINDASIGLMQVLVGTAKTLDASATKDKLLNAEYNIHVGTRYIRKNLDRYNGNIKDAIAAYNAGSAFKASDGSYVSASGNDVQYYVDRVYKNYIDYSNWLGSGTPMLDVKPEDLLIGFVIVAGIVVFYYKKSK